MEIVFADITDPDNLFGLSNADFAVLTSRPCYAEDGPVDGAHPADRGEGTSPTDSEALKNILFSQVQLLYPTKRLFDGGYAPERGISGRFHVLDWLSNRDPTAWSPLTGQELKDVTRRHMQLTPEERWRVFYETVAAYSPHKAEPLDSLWTMLGQLATFNVKVMGPCTALAMMPDHLYDRIGQIDIMNGTLDEGGSKNLLRTNFNYKVDQAASEVVIDKLKRSGRSKVVFFPTESVKQPSLYINEEDLDAICPGPKTPTYRALRAKLEQWCNKAAPGRQPLFDFFLWLPTSSLPVHPADVEFGENPTAPGTRKFHVKLTGPEVAVTAPGFYAVDDSCPARMVAAFHETLRRALHAKGGEIA